MSELENPKFIEEYKKILNVEQIEKNIDDLYMKEKIKKLKYKYSSVSRLSIYNKMFLTVLPKKVEYTTTVFRVYRPDLNKETIFAYLYSYIDSKNMIGVKIPNAYKKKSISNGNNLNSINKQEKNKQKNKSNNKLDQISEENTFKIKYIGEVNDPIDKLKKFITHEYISHGQTYNSCDGEFRHRFFTYEQLISIYNNYQQIFKEIINFLQKQKEIIIRSNTFYSSQIENHTNFEYINEAFSYNLDHTHIGTILYMASWLLGYNDVRFDRKANHVDEKYFIAMFGLDGEKNRQISAKTYKSDHKEFYDHLIHTYSVDQIRSLSQELTYLLKYPYTKDEKIVECGQKLIPLKVKEIENYGNIKYSPWRERYINSLVNSLVINGISPCVPIYVDWFLINSTNIGLFENKNSYNKIEQSEVAKKIVKNLENARRDTYIYDKEEIFLSQKMEGLSSSIEYPMDYAEAEIILSNTTLCTIGEYLGRTFADMPTLLIKPKYKHTDNFFESTEFFAKYIFEYIYTLLCLNQKLGLIHGDLHLNNITIFYNRTFDIEIPNPYVLYYMDEYSYIFKTFGFYSCIIDSSRSIIDEDRIKKDYPDRENEYLVIQRRRLINLLEQLMPEFAERYKLDIEVLLFKKYQLMFKICTALDTYKMTRSMLEFLKDKTIKENLELLQKINRISFNFVRNKIIQAIQDSITYPNDIPYPNNEILFECFENYRLDNFLTKSTPEYLESLSLIDVFNFTNPIVYESRFHENIPKILQIDYLIKNNLIKSSEYRTLLSKYSNYLKYIEKINIEQIAEEEENKKEERRGIILENDILKKNMNDKIKGKGKKKEKEVINESTSESISEMEIESDESIF